MEISVIVWKSSRDSLGSYADLRLYYYIIARLVCNLFTSHHRHITQWRILRGILFCAIYWYHSIKQWYYEQKLMFLLLYARGQFCVVTVDITVLLQRSISHISNAIFYSAKLVKFPFLLSFIFMSNCTIFAEKNGIRHKCVCLLMILFCISNHFCIYD